MSVTRDDGARTDGSFGDRYRRAFLRYLVSGDEADVTPAYELSREAVGGHLSLLELAEAHRRAVAEGVLPERDAQQRALLAERAADFLRESLATFEIAHRGYLEVQEVARLEHEHARQLQSVAEVSVALNAALPVADVIDLVTAEARHVLGGRSARAHLELPGAQPRRTLTATSGEVPSEQAQAGQSVLRASLTGRRGLVVGEIEVFGAETTDPGAEAILVQLAQVASAAIGNAQIYGLEREIAETLQRSLLPQRLPKIDGLDVEARYCAAGDGMVVGGDFYDVFRTNGTAWGLAIGDVCGKGPHAAALTALVRYTLRAAALWEHRPERVMAMLNEAILDQRADHRFCTAIYGQLALRPEGGARVDFVTAGHPLPLVRRAGGEVEAVGTHSTVLGVVPDPSLHTDTVELAPGDLLVMYTDGVTEVRKRGREVFGVDQLRALLGEIGDVSAAKAAERVEDAVLNASGGPPRDDLAVVAVRIPPA
ncbi:SpoIIE family protein phosphatase [Conexibacter stalactiti]|uniref:SpoIIE family protein phosphatase n=1 Tax=Conexibacter stalactiti TaxID=1940611 RepID=A0ABU4HZB1_9ACTN|nr:SpoIIE family protein phosphatase [Conexibacter stalactiti]MDW5598494.1 SpoIIE family protein phosphatase [Conexibacter stalactiti]MEC5039136.1 SpoIIE family protein phosphatase [Conexibacter stalactiti]